MDTLFVNKVLIPLGLFAVSCLFSLVVLTIKCRRYEDPYDLGTKTRCINLLQSLNLYLFLCTCMILFFFFCLWLCYTFVFKICISYM
ncbi:hypothetical protein AtNW77_Chr3g0184981 [Arabidopsis thaliana]